MRVCERGRQKNVTAIVSVTRKVISLNVVWNIFPLRYSKATEEWRGWKGNSDVECVWERERQHLLSLVTIVLALMRSVCPNLQPEGEVNASPW